MIRIQFLTPPDGTLQGFLMEGHAGYGEAGTDIVCAAVSSAAYLTVNTLTEICHVSPLSLRVGEGEMFFRIEPKDEPICRDLLAGLKLHLTSLEEQYPDGLRVSYMEI
jgi:uncharacterized protein YsxB (DUF464 family)